MLVIFGNAVVLATELLEAGHRIHIDGDRENVEVSVPIKGAVRASLVAGLADLAERNGYRPLVDFANQAVRFVAIEEDLRDA